MKNTKILIVLAIVMGTLSNKSWSDERFCQTGVRYFSSMCKEGDIIIVRSSITVARYCDFDEKMVTVEEYGDVVCV